MCGMEITARRGSGDDILLVTDETDRPKRKCRVCGLTHPAMELNIGGPDRKGWVRDSSQNGHTSGHWWSRRRKRFFKYV